jgi:uncharacterized protein involved in exopolysaccharide biosynthesis
MINSHADRVQVLPSRPGADEVDPADYLWALWRYRAVLLATTLVCGGVAYAIAAASQPSYQGTAFVTMAPPGGGELAYAVIVKARNLLQNASVVQRALARHPETTAGLTPGSFVAKNLSIERNRDTNLFAVTVTLPDAAAAADTANFITDEAVSAYARMVAEEKPVETAPVALALRREAAEADSRLDNARNALVRFRQRSRIDDIRGQNAASLRLPGDIAAATAALQGERAALAQVLNDLAATSRLIPLSSNPYDDSSAGTGSGRQYLNPVYATLEGRASDSRARIASLERQRAALVDEQARFARTASALPGLELELTRLQSAYDRALALQVDAHGRLEQALKAPPVVPPAAATVSVTERASPPDSPVAPRPRRSLLLGLAFGAFTSVLLALLLDAVRVKRFSPDERASVV